MIMKLHGHLGDTVAALVDGQLSAADEERAWAHVHGCPGCQRLVAREGWVKAQLRGLQPSSSLSARLLDELAQLPAADSWEQVHALEEHARRRRTAAALGVGSVGAAALALVALTGAPGPSRAPLDRAPASFTPTVGPSVVSRDVVRAAFDSVVRPVGLAASGTAVPPGGAR